MGETIGAWQLHLVLVDLLLPHQALQDLQPPLHHHQDANSPNGKVMVGVTMATTMLIVLMMEEIAVEIMSKLPTAQFVNAKKEPQLQPQLQPPQPPPQLQLPQQQQPRQP